MDPKRPWLRGGAQLGAKRAKVKPANVFDLLDKAEDLTHAHAGDAHAEAEDGTETNAHAEAQVGAGGSAGADTPVVGEARGDEEDDDPLDAFMAGVQQDLRQEAEHGKREGKARLDDIALDEVDDHVSYMEARKASNARASATSAATRTQSGAGYDSDEEVYATARAVEKGSECAKQFGGGPLQPIDHSAVEYLPFQKNFYQAHPSILNLSENEVRQRRRALDIQIGGYEAPCPVPDFEAMGLDKHLLAMLKRRQYENPTPIQSQAIPAVLSGRDVLGIAKTGSGKTAAFALPMVSHILDQDQLSRNEGPIAVVLAPTRELAVQILVEVRKLTKAFGISTAGIFGGMSKLDQFKELKGVCDVVVCTPGRMIDLIKMKACNFRRVTYVVLDEADRMFDMGFEPQVWSLMGQIRPDAQTLLFSATMPRKVEHLAQGILTDPVRITVGRTGEANEDVKQVVHVLNDDTAKVPWLFRHIEAFRDDGNVLVFVNHRSDVEGLVDALCHKTSKAYKATGLHGDMAQVDRIAAIKGFKDGTVHILVATDVASRGLDIPTIKTVVNLDAARDIETHIHRVGRTGRAGDKEGVAHTLVTRKQSRFAGNLVNSLAWSHQQIPRDLYELATRDRKFYSGRQRKSRQMGKSGRNVHRYTSGHPSTNFVAARSQAGGGGGSLPSSQPQRVSVLPAQQPLPPPPSSIHPYHQDHPSGENASDAAKAAAAAITRKLQAPSQHSNSGSGGGGRVNPSRTAAERAAEISARIQSSGKANQT